MQEDGLGESLASCVDADATAWSDGTLTIDATNSTSGIVIVSPGNSVVKVNGRTCMAGGSKIPLTSVSNIVVNGRANASDTFVLDFSAGLPKTPLLQENGILINGNETVFSSKTPDTVVIRGSAGADVVTAGLNPDISQGEIDIALTPNSKVAHIALLKLGQTAPGPFAPKLVVSLGAGDDTFNGLGDFPDVTPATPVNFGMAIYGGPGNDTLVGGLGGDKIDGGGQASDSLSYVDRTIDPVFVDSGSTKVSVWGGDLRGVTTKVGGKTYIDRGNGSLTAVTFSGEATPASIVAAINGALGANVASTVGNRLRLTSTGSRIVINSTYADDTTATLGLQNGVYENVGNDGAAGAALAVPWKSPSAISASATAYAAGDVVVPISANGYWYKATVAGTSAGGDPSWSTTLGANVSDGGVTWTTGGRVWKAAVKWAPGDVLYDLGNSAVYEILECTGRTGALTTLAASNGATKVDGGVTWTTRGSTWLANTSYTSGDYAVKTSANGFYYKALNSGTSHATTEPSWPTAVGSTVVDGSVTWVCAGTAPILAGNTQYALGDFVRDASGTLGTMTDSAMLSGNSLPSMGPTHSNVADGDVFWTYQGPLSEGDDVQGVAVLNGGAGNDILVGSSGANTLNGNDGDDILAGGPVMVASLSCPMDKLNGGAGDDWFDMGGDESQPALGKNDCNQTISGGSGLDVVDYSQRSNASILLVKLDGTTASGEQSSTPREADKIGSDVEIALGGAGLDLITGSDDDDYLYGGPGNDRIYGGKGDDHIYGGAGDDYLYGDLGNDTFYELSSFQTSSAWNEPLQATTWAGLGRSIYGSEKPGAGDDLVMGGTDLSETNKIDFSDAANPVAIAICSDGSAANATLKTCAPGVSDYVQISRDGTTATPGASGTKNSYINVEYVAGSLTQPNVFIGSANSEVFEGGAGVDVILGQGGQDTLSGSPDIASGVSKDNTSIDILCGGDGDDLLSGGTNALLEGEGQMDQAHATQNTTAVRIGGSSSQAPSFCTDPSNAVFSVVRGNNMCFGSNKTHCLN
jgi:Ca2+-binding RTX toxin-like protein